MGKITITGSRNLLTSFEVVFYYRLGATALTPGKNAIEFQIRIYGHVQLGEAFWQTEGMLRMSHLV